MLLKLYHLGAMEKWCVLSLSSYYGLLSYISDLRNKWGATSAGVGSGMGSVLSAIWNNSRSRGRSSNPG